MNTLLLKSLAVFAITTLCGVAPAFAECQQIAPAGPKDIGKKGRLISNASAPGYGEYDVLSVYTWKQTGPEKWSADPKAKLPFGEEVEIAGVFKERAGPSDSTRLFEVRTKDGKQHVVSDDNVVPFDIYQCTISLMLVPNSPTDSRKFRYLPVIPSPDARPIDRKGDWVPEEDLKKVPFVVCSEYNYRNPSQGNKPTFECRPVYNPSPFTHDWYYLDASQLRLVKPGERPNGYLNH